jgi:hypothetical protein
MVSLMAVGGVKGHTLQGSKNILLRLLTAIHILIWYGKVGCMLASGCGLIGLGSLTIYINPTSCLASLAPI